jgi:hypothetical protein
VPPSRLPLPGLVEPLIPVRAEGCPPARSAPSTPVAQRRGDTGITALEPRSPCGTAFERPLESDRGRLRRGLAATPQDRLAPRGQSRPGDRERSGAERRGRCVVHGRHGTSVVLGPRGSPGLLLHARQAVHVARSEHGDEASSQSGLGDTVQSFFLSPREPTAGGWSGGSARSFCSRPAPMSF